MSKEEIIIKQNRVSFKFIGEKETEEEKNDPGRYISADGTQICYDRCGF